jgi:hypothetical protein
MLCIPHSRQVVIEISLKRLGNYNDTYHLMNTYYVLGTILIHPPSRQMYAEEALDNGL